jgi:hypothetical protein
LSYLPRKSVFGATLPGRWDEGWRQGLASGKPRVLVLGDSQTTGMMVGAGDTQTEGFRAKLRDALAAKISGGLCAEFHPVCYNPSLLTATGYTWLGANHPWTQNTAPASQTTPAGALNYTWQDGFGNAARWSAPTNNADLMTFNGPANVAFNDADIILANKAVSSPPGKYVIDGGASNNLTNISAADTYLTHVQLRGIGNTDHSIVIDGAGPGTELWLCGLTTYYGGATGNGLYFASVGFPAGDLSNHRPEAFNNFGGRTTAGGFGALGFPACPHLLVLAHGLNDGRTTPAFIFADRAAMLVRMLRRAGEAHYGSGFTLSVLVVLMDAPDGGTLGFTGAPSDGPPHGGLTVGATESWMQYMTQMVDCVGPLNVGVLSFKALAKERLVGKGWAPSAEAHLNAAGHLALSDFIMSVLF